VSAELPSAPHTRSSPATAARISFPLTEQLHCAAKGGSEQVVKALLHAGSIPDVNQPVLVENEERPLHIAAKAGHSAAAAALIGAGASVDCRDRNGWTPLALAARFGRIEVRCGGGDSLLHFFEIFHLIHGS